jgi:hypothetical protein
MARVANADNTTGFQEFLCGTRILEGINARRRENIKKIMPRRVAVKSTEVPESPDFQAIAEMIIIADVDGASPSMCVLIGTMSP